MSAPPLPAELTALLTELGVDPRRARLRRLPGRSDRSYLALPSARQPQILVPLAPAGGDLVVERRSRTRAGRAAKSVVAAALRTGAAGLLPLPRLMIEDDAWIELVTWLGGGPGDRLGVLVGPPRANRKPVLRLLAADGGTLAFAKMGTTEVTSGLVRAESAALAEVARLAWRTLRAPQVLRAGSWRGREVVVTSALCADGQRQPDQLPAEQTREIAQTGERRDVPVGATSALAAADPATWGTWGPLLVDLRDRLDAEIGDRRLPVGAAHGDWAPWNMAWSGEVLEVWDWERFDPQVPQGFDALHFAAAGVRVGTADAEVAEARFLTSLPRQLERAGVDPALTDPLLALYLLGTARRYATDLTQVPVASVEARLAWVLRLLKDRVHRIERGAAA